MTRGFSAESLSLRWQVATSSLDGSRPYLEQKPPETRKHPNYSTKGRIERKPLENRPRWHETLSDINRGVSSAGRIRLRLADGLLREGVPGFGFLAWFVGLAYVLAIVPAWLTAAVDWAIFSKPLWIRLLAVMTVSAVLAEIVAWFMGQPSFNVPVSIAGAVPAAACYWLAGMNQA